MAMARELWLKGYGSQRIAKQLVEAGVAEGDIHNIACSVLRLKMRERWPKRAPVSWTRRHPNGTTTSFKYVPAPDKLSDAQIDAAIARRQQETEVELAKIPRRCGGCMATVTGLTCPYCGAPR